MQTVYVIAAVFFCSLFMFLAEKKRKKHLLLRDRAASLLLREQLLTKAIKGKDAREHYFPVLFISFRVDGKREYAFKGSSGVRIGRDPEKNEISIRHPYVSGRHARVYMADGRVFLEDLGSANGTFIRRGPGKVRMAGTTVLRQGDVFYVGEVGFRVYSRIYDPAYLT